MNLPGYIARRLLLFGPMLIGITLFSFLLSHAVPADPVTANLGEQAASNPEIVAAFRHAWGLDRPLHEQYLIYLWKLAHGDFGISISTKQAVALDLRQRFPATVELAMVAMAISLIVGIPLGILSAVKRDSLIDQLARVLSLVGVSMPVFWLGLVALVVFYAHLGWAPAPGRLSADLIPPTFATGFLLFDALLQGRSDVAVDALRHLALPAIVLSSYTLGVITRMTRGSLLETLGEDYVRTARAKGLSNMTVVVRHAVRNGLIPLVTIVGLSFGRLLSGAVVTESVFSWPGLGLYAFRSATSLDFPAIMGVGIVIAAIYILVNLIVDIAYGLLDPRIRVG
ncbi:MAG TPA: ABC transporter permease [Candidatus Methylomirabilis sp.]|nr:ABC transporter permease [Candidatus Methylomirabilis sp.]